MSKYSTDVLSIMADQMASQIVEVIDGRMRSTDADKAFLLSLLSARLMALVTVSQETAEEREASLAAQVELVKDYVSNMLALPSAAAPGGTNVH